MADNGLKLRHREEENLMPLHKPNYISCFDHKRKKVFLANLSAYEENCFRFVLGVIFADQTSEFDTKEAPYQIMSIFNTLSK